MKKILCLFIILAMVFALSVPSFAVSIPEKPYENSNFFTYKDYTLHYRVYDGDSADKKQIMLIHGFCLSTALIRIRHTMHPRILLKNILRATFPIRSSTSRITCLVSSLSLRTISRRASMLPMT